ncbi:MAG: protein kinase, partial [Blastocatellia bacterium]|nr:protein kinase [Blastocatellia bacterium]
MTADRWQKIKELFSAAQGRPENERAELLTRACGSDAELRSEVEKLLESHLEDSFLERSATKDLGGLISIEFSDAADVLMSMDAPQRLEPGATLNERYQIIRLLGRGGMGEVYLAIDSRINRNVAIKLLHPDLVSNKESLRRFALEAHAVSALNHPHIMTIYDFETVGEGTVFIVAEYVDGRTLNNLIGEIDVEKALDVGIQVSSALAAAHQAGITHRDIKPENIMVRPDGYIKVLDFGLAKLTQQRTASTSGSSDAPTQALPRTKPGMIMGTAAYMSPEQARGLHVDARADVWSLGAVLYEMLTGLRPFTGDTQADVIVAVLLSSPPPVTRSRPGLPAELDTIVAKAMSKDAASRYQTIKQVRNDLERVRKQIHFDESFVRSGESEPANWDPTEAATMVVTLGKGVKTAGDPARPTDGGGDEEVKGGVQESRSLSSVTDKHRTLRSVFIGSTVVVLLSLAGYFAFLSPGSAQQIDSIAVLPFANLSEDPDLAYLSNGLSDTLIDRLSQLPQLKVISRGSSSKFRDRYLDPVSVASELDVRAIVTGTVSRDGDYLAVRFDITDTAENTQLGGGQLRRKADDLVSIQNEIAQTAVEQLRLKLTDAQSRRIADR